MTILDRLPDYQPEPGDDWRLLAACRGVDPDVFFPPAHDYEALKLARSYCARCPVRDECADWADRHESTRRQGIFGGMAPRQRAQRRRNNGITFLRGRSLNDDRPPEPWCDGTLYSYWRGCKCRRCRDTKAAYARRLRARNRGEAL